MPKLLATALDHLFLPLLNTKFYSNKLSTKFGNYFRKIVIQQKLNAPGWI